ncbi:hypothetical protein FHN55_04385 [Streptomyces sp. NP160]|uniref:protein kinase family protein n=1 Tax=Streptomyces sp. NP160 TaxID=2586637 RepID=UPI001118DFDD|nr:protein kinase family protein [Streptomyces sp. NP160]TNM69047.1 hypothetical protein FHN55_04385 [Streptomyces sp. NP160]
MADRTTPLPSRGEEPGHLASGTATGTRTTGRSRSSAGSVGVLLDGRYRLLQRRTKDGAWATWDGEDDQLLRPVVLTVVSGPTAAEAVDAARRSATLEDERLPHLLDVGLERAVDGTALGWVVTERSPGRTLADLLRESPLPSARARALVGEAAAVLARASRSGLHHRRLEPSAVTLTADGAVSVLGLEVAAAAAGLPPRSPAEAEHEDAEGLVRVLYAAITGLWPAGRSGALGAAPTGRGGSPVAPGDLTPGVPHDLDALCQAVLGPYREGPATPADVAAALAPWGSSTGPVTRTGLGLPAAPATGAPGSGRGSGAAAEVGVAAGGAAAGAWASAPARARLGGGPGLHFAGGDAPGGDDGGPVVHTTRAERRAAQRRAERDAERAAHGEDAFEALLGPVTGPRHPVPPVLERSAQTAAAAGAAAEDAWGVPAPAQPTRRVEQPAVRRTEVPADPSQAPEPAATAPLAPRRRQHEDRRHGDDRDRGSSRSVSRSAASAPPATAAAFSDTDATDWVSAGWGHAPAGAEAVSGSRRGASGSRIAGGDGRRRRGPVLAVLVVLVLLLVAAVLLLTPRVPQIAGALGIARSSTAAPGASAGAAPSAAAPAADPSASAAPEAATGPGEITGAQAQDPFGDSTENDESASRAVDGDPATGWRSSTYSNAALGNLKRGVGLGLVLGDGTTPSTVTALQLSTEGTGGRLEVRSSPDGGYDGSTVVATTEAGTGGATVEVPLDQPTETTHLLLWFTELPQTSSGYTATVGEVSAR